MTAQNATPNWQTPIVDSTGNVTPSWYQFFARQTAKPQAIAPVKPTGGVHTYTASQNGSLAVSGGAVSSITLARARVTGVNVGFTSGIVPMSQGDSVTITYSVEPTVNFIPT